MNHIKERIIKCPYCAYRYANNPKNTYQGEFRCPSCGFIYVVSGYRWHMEGEYICKGEKNEKKTLFS